MTRMKLSFLFFFAFLIGALWQPVYSVYQNLSGKCVAQKRTLTNDEIIFLAAQNLNHQPLFYIKRYDVAVQRVPYTSTEKLLAENPGCCRIVRSSMDAPPTTSFNKMRGYDTKIVATKVLTDYINPSGLTEREMLSAVARVGNCGEIIGNWHFED